eukprot:m.22581 g.22581  ORF g.22581 m.22581 type:complete len:1649 (+) comp8401_c0_seq2:477-5423(+)
MEDPEIEDLFFKSLQESVETGVARGGLKQAVIQFEVGPHKIYLDASDRSQPPTIARGAHAKPDATISSTIENFVDVVVNRITPMRAVRSKKLTFQGNRFVLMEYARFIRPAFELCSAHYISNQQAAVSAAKASTTADGAAAVRTKVARPSTPELLARVWVPDDDRAQCPSCNSRFSFLRRRHHCRGCGEVFCDDCSEFYYNQHRMCQPCQRKMMAISTTHFPVVVEPQSQVPLTTARIDQDAMLLNSEGSAGADDDERVDASEVQPSARQLHLQSLGLLERKLQQRIFEMQDEVVSAHPIDETKSSTNATSAADDQQPDDAAESGAPNPSQSKGVLVLFCSLAVLFMALTYPQVYEFHTTTTAVSTTVTKATASNVSHTSSVQATLSGEPEWFPTMLWLLSFTSMFFSGPFGIIGLSYLMFLCLPHFFPNSMLVRQARVYFAAIIVAGRIYGAKLLDKVIKDGSDSRWSWVNAQNAKQVRILTQELCGFWVKVGQYLSSRGDVMPQEWVNELRVLQDTMPFQPFEDVKQTVENELGRPLSEVFSFVDKEPLAAASIAQVHIAHLKQDNKKVVIKVQHRNIDVIMNVDLRNLLSIVKWIAYFEPEMDFRPVLDEWSKVAIRELDFTNEAANMTRVRNNLLTSDLDVIVPELVTDLHTSKVLVMEYCQGFKVTDTEKLDAHGIDREALMRLISQAYAHQLYLDGFFNCDPHPGNILIQVKDGKAIPVLLDYGMCRELPRNKRRAFARMVFSASHMDFGSLLTSFEEMGLVLRRDDPFEDMKNIRFLLRDTAPGSEMRKDFKKFQEEQWQKRQEMPQSQRNPVEAWPPELLFFLRVTLLLRGLCAVLDVRLKYTSVLAPYAQLAIIRSYDASEHAKVVHEPFVASQIKTSMQVLAGDPSSKKSMEKFAAAARAGGGSGKASGDDTPLHTRAQVGVLEQLRSLYLDGTITGVQVAAYHNGQLVVDACAGTMGETDPRPIMSDTLFNSFSVTKAVASAALNMLLDQELLHLNDLVGEYWPEYNCNGKQLTTVRHVLTHTAGLHAFPGLDVNMTQLCNWETMLSLVAAATPATTPGAHCIYHHLSFGWIVGGLLEKVTKQPFQEFVRQRIAIPLQLKNDFFIGVDTEDQSVTARIATLANGYLMNPDGSAPTEDDVRQLAKTVKESFASAHTPQAQAHVNNGSMDEQGSSASQAENEGDEDAQQPARDPNWPPQTTLASGTWKDLGDEMHLEFMSDVLVFDEPWELVKEARGVKVYRKSIPGSDDIVVKGVTTIKRHPKAIYDTLCDLTTKPKWNDQFDWMEDVEVVDELSRVIHDVYKPIWPVAARDFCLYQTFRFLDDGGFALASKSVDHPNCSQAPKAVRGYASIGGVLIKPDPNDMHTCQLVYMMGVDPKGNIPKFVVNTVATSQPLSAAGIREVVMERPDYTFTPPAPSHSQVREARSVSDVQQRLSASSDGSGSGSDKVKTTKQMETEEPSTTATPLQAVDEASDLAAISDGADLDPSKLLLMDPCAYNTRKIRGAVIPSANGHFSARALARFYASLSHQPGIRPLFSLATMEAATEAQAVTGASLAGGSPTRFGLGFQKYSLRRLDGTTVDSPFGHTGFGGSIAFCDPVSKLSVAILVNRLDFAYVVREPIVEAITKALNLGDIVFV